MESCQNRVVKEARPFFHPFIQILRREETLYCLRRITVVWENIGYLQGGELVVKNSVVLKKRTIFFWATKFIFLSTKERLLGTHHHVGGALLEKISQWF